jgi:hypothetical protein
MVFDGSGLGLGLYLEDPCLGLAYRLSFGASSTSLMISKQSIATVLNLLSVQLNLIVIN